MRTVLLYGNSLIVSSVGASLRGREGLRVLPLDSVPRDAARELSELRPDAVIFDLAAAQSDFAVALWKARPDLLLIGVDLTTGRALVLSGQPARALTTEDLLQVIESHANGLEKEKETIANQTMAQSTDKPTVHS